MTTVRAALVETMVRYMPDMLAQTIAEGLPPPAQREIGTLDVVVVADLLQWLDGRLKLFARDKAVPAETLDAVRRSLTAGRPPPPAFHTVVIENEADILTAQRTARAILKHFFGSTDCVRLVTVVSELSRNIYMYARRGFIELTLAEDRRGILFTVTARDQGPGIADLDAILAGKFTSRSGLGRGIRGSKAILDELSISTGPGKGTVIVGTKRSRTVR